MCPKLHHVSRFTFQNDGAVAVFMFSHQSIQQKAKQAPSTSSVVRSGISMLSTGFLFLGVELPIMLFFSYSRS